MTGIWQEFLNIAQQEAGSQMVETWLRAVRLLEWNASEQTVLLQTPNTFVCEWLQQHYLSFFVAHLSRLFNVDEIKIIFEVATAPDVRITPAVVIDSAQGAQDANQRPQVEQTRLFDNFIPAQVLKASGSLNEHQAQRSHAETSWRERPTFSAAQSMPKHEPMAPGRELAKRPTTSAAPATSMHKVSATHLNAAFTFENFVVGPSNELAYAATMAAAEGHTGYNPLFLYAPSGLGKTHLLHAVGNVVMNRKPSLKPAPWGQEPAPLRVLYQTAERFVQEYINAIRFEKIHQFQLKYKFVDMLLIDDVQFLSNKEQTQEAFFHIFNALYDAHKQLIFSSDTYPHQLSGIADRLRSRFESGLIVDIQAPLLETKIAILNKKAGLNGVVLPYDVAHFLAARNTGNIRTLEGSLIQVMAVAALTKQPITLEAAKRALMRYGQEKIANAVNLEHIVKGVCEHYSYTLSELRSDSKVKDVAFARQVAMYLMKKMTGKSLQEIGYFLGRKDHSTVLHALGKIKNWIKTSPDFSAQLMSLEAKILS